MLPFKIYIYTHLYTKICFFFVVVFCRLCKLSTKVEKRKDLKCRIPSQGVHTTLWDPPYTLQSHWESHAKSVHSLLGSWSSHKTIILYQFTPFKYKALLNHPEGTIITYIWNRRLMFVHFRAMSIQRRYLFNVRSCF